MISEKEHTTFLARLQEPSWLLDKRKEAFARMQKSPKPSFRCGLSIRVAPKLDLDKISLPEEGMLSVAGGDILDGPEREALIKESWTESKERLGHQHQAFATITVLRLPPQGDVHLHYHAQGKHCAHTLILHAPKESSCTVTYTKDGEATYVSERIHILAEQDANVRVTSVQAYGKETTSTQQYSDIQDKGAKVEWTDLQVGSAYARSHINSELAGEQSSTQHTVLYLGTGEQSFELSSQAAHKGKKSKSRLSTRGALTGKAQALARGLILIENGASKSTGTQRQDALLLSEHAKAYANPDLQIHNKDVHECRHGSSIGSIDEEKLFYLTSRGLSEQDARKLIVLGYYQPVLDKLPDKTKEIITKAAEAAL